MTQRATIGDTAASTAKPGDGPAAGQVWNAENYATKAGFVPVLGAGVMALLDAKAGERILDIGCGDGVLTAKLAECGAEVVGLEPSPELAAAARARGVNVIEADAHVPFGEKAYDAVFSNAAFHWFRDAETVLANAFAALRPGGRIVVEQGGFGNVAAITVALLASLEAAGYPERAKSPWDFPSATRQRARLEKAGFTVNSIELFTRSTHLAAGMEGWLETFGDAFMSGLDEKARDTVLKDTTRRLECLHEPGIGWWGDYVRLRFHATKSA